MFHRLLPRCHVRLARARRQVGVGRCLGFRRRNGTGTRTTSTVRLPWRHHIICASAGRRRPARCVLLLHVRLLEALPRMRRLWSSVTTRSHCTPSCFFPRIHRAYPSGSPRKHATWTAWTASCRTHYRFANSLPTFSRHARRIELRLVRADTAAAAGTTASSTSTSTSTR